MKKMICLMLSLVFLLTGCRSAGTAPSHEATQPSPSETTAPAATDPTETTDAEETTAVTQPTVGAVMMGQTGKLRIDYTGNRSGIRYVTDPTQLPDYPELAAYDEAYFRDHGLLLVTETVTSGSVNVEIQSIVTENGFATVTLDHKIPAGLGTADMATWLLWVEVDAGLDLTWVLANPALKPDTQQNERY